MLGHLLFLLPSQNPAERVWTPQEDTLCHVPAADPSRAEPPLRGYVLPTGRDFELCTMPTAEPELLLRLSFSLLR